MTDIAAYSQNDILADLTVASPKPGVSIEITDVVQFAVMQADWDDLLGRAAELNAFMSPVLVRAAARSYPQSRPRVVLAWKTIEDRRRLTGVWVFAVGYANKSLLPIRVLTAPPFSYGYLATPVVDRAFLEETLDAMLDRIADDPDLPKIIALDSMGMEGPAMAALVNVLAGRGNAPCILEQARRPKLESDQDSKQYFQNALSNSSRKKLRQRRRRLSEKGVLTSEIISDPNAIPKAIDEFFSLEASGWKGRHGTALHCSDADAAFFRTGFAALAQHGCASIHSLRLDKRLISMQLVVRAGHAAFTWKTAYDEDFSKFSPGKLLLEDYTAAFLGDKRIRFVDSCAQDDTSYMSIWTERQQVGDLLIDARRGGSHAFQLLGKLEMMYRGLRTTAKQYYLQLRHNQAAR